LRAEAAALLGRASEREEGLSRLSPRDAALERTPEADLGRVREALGEKTALLDYAEGSRRLYVYVLTREKLSFVDLGARAAVGEAVERFREAAGRPSGPSARAGVAEAGRRAFLLLVAPALAEAGEEVERLVIVPSAALASIPFEALVSDRKGAGEPAS